MQEGTTITGEEYISQQLEGTQVEVALVAETLSEISNADDIGNLTEPATSSDYQRKSTTLTQISPTELANADDVKLNITGSSIVINSFVYLVYYQSDAVNDSSPSLHILQPGELAEPADPSTGTNFVRFLSETAPIRVE